MAEASTMARSTAVDEFGQRAYFISLERFRGILVAASPGLHEGKTYTELRAHMVCGSDEEGIMVNTNGTRLIGRVAKKQHLINTDDSRASATVLRTGFAVGLKGPSMYIGTGKTKSAFITTAFLERNGAPAGSIYDVNPAAYMTNDFWDKHVESFCIALRNSSPVARANPEWWMEWHVDGFGSKVNTPHGQQILRQYRIGCFQSQSHTSHVNQVSTQIPNPPHTCNQIERCVWEYTLTSHPQFTDV
jgi:hypothetical protein